MQLAELAFDSSLKLAVSLSNSRGIKLKKGSSSRSELPFLRFASSTSPAE